MLHLIRVAILLGEKYRSDSEIQFLTILPSSEHVDGGGGGRGVPPGAIEGKKALDGELIRAGER